ncbi:MAG: GTPase domain-containing protein [Akkermansia muciniphila]
MKIKVAIIGEFQDGKSTLINALSGQFRAETGWGTATTSKVEEYSLPGTDCILLDTPGFNYPREGDGSTTYSGIQDADAFLLLLSQVQATDKLLDEVQRCMRVGSKGRRPIIPLINDRDRNNRAIQDISVAKMHRRGFHPILFGSEMPCFNARRWEKGRQDEDDYAGIRRLKYLLGIHPSRIPSPLTLICGIMGITQRVIHALTNTQIR